MKLSEIKALLNTVASVDFRLPDGSFVPEHFHVTEVGVVTKHFIDCGGTVRNEKVANFQLMEDLDIEVEYQSDTIGKYGLDFDGKSFVLQAKQTDCLAQDKCGIPQEKPKVKLSDLTSSNATACCTPGGGCC